MAWNRVIAVAGVTACIAVAFGLREATAGSKEGPATLSISDRAAASTAVSPMTSTAVIDPQLDETFSPLSSTQQSVAPSMTADQAWAAFANLNGYSQPTVPADLTVFIGSLTLPNDNVGPASAWTYRYQNEIAYGYSEPPAQCINTSTRTSTSQDAGTCVTWTFLSPSTGQLLDQTDQAVASTSKP